MKILIIGTGVIGTLYAHGLSKYHEVIHYVRENKFQDLNGKTICYDIIDERESKKLMYTKGEYTYNCITKIDCDYDLIIVPVNSFQLNEAIEELVKQAPNAHFLLFTLNWNGTNEIDNMLKKEQYIFGYAGGGGTFKENILWGNIGDDITLGTVHEEQKKLLFDVINIFKVCDFKPEVPENVLHWLWIHNAGTSPMGVGLSKYNDIDKYLNDKELVNITFKAMNECYEICRRRGVKLKGFPEVKMMKMPFFILYPLFKNNFRNNPVMKRYTAHAILAISEMKDNFINIYNLGKGMNVEMPNMEKLHQLILY